MAKGYRTQGGGWSAPSPVLAVRCSHRLGKLERRSEGLAVVSGWRHCHASKALMHSTCHAVQRLTSAFWIALSTKARTPGAVQTLVHPPQHRKRKRKRLSPVACNRPLSAQ